MELLKKGAARLLLSPPARAAQAICERLETNPELEERRTALRELLDSAKAQPMAVAEVAIPTLVSIIRKDASDPDNIQLAIEICSNIVEADGVMEGSEHEQPVRVIDAFMQADGMMGALLYLLQESDIYVRYDTIQLLTKLLNKARTEVESTILSNPMAIMKLMDALEDRRTDFLRNEALTLLLSLTTSNQELQKIIVFQGAFDRLFEIILEEGGQDGGVIAKDCLFLILNLLRNNFSNQNFFRETPCWSKIPPLLRLPAENSSFSTNQEAIIGLTLEVIHGCIAEVTSLTSTHPKPLNSTVAANQKWFGRKEILSAVVTLGVTVPCPLGPEKHFLALSVINCLLLQNSVNKQTIPEISISAYMGSAENAVVGCLLVHMLNSQSSQVRITSLLCCQTYLSSNPSGQLSLISSMAPSPFETDSVDVVSVPSIGRQIVTALSIENNASLSPSRHDEPGGESGQLRLWGVWAVCDILYRCLFDNADCKELALSLPVEVPRDAGPAEGLLAKIMKALFEFTRQMFSTDTSNAVYTDLVKACVGILRVLIGWFANHINGLNVFYQTGHYLVSLVDIVSHPNTQTHVQGLTALFLGLCLHFRPSGSVSNEQSSADAHRLDNTKLLDILSRNVGLQNYTAKMDAVKRTEQFRLAERGFNATKHVDALYDSQFAKLFAEQYDKIQGSIISMMTGTRGAKGSTAATKMDSSDSAALEQYKDLIRMQDRELKDLRAKNEELMLQLREALVKGSSVEHTGVSKVMLDAAVAEAKALKAEVDSLRVEVARRGEELSQARAHALKTESTHHQELNQVMSRAQDEIRSLTVAYNGLEDALMEKSTELDRGRIRSSQLQKEVNRLTEELRLEQQRKAPVIVSSDSVNGSTGPDSAQTVEQLTAQLNESHRKLQEVIGRVQSLEEESESWKNRFNHLNADHEDLLVLLAWQDQQMNEAPKVTGETEAQTLLA
eukprot:GILJ01011812.1.p1 GENE.GILJ01011812.1~~GILJ01011812.1.p1  ORF type:complete len:956 (-),score=170.61 GILJ01011812.1:76-2943(-)